MLDINLLWNLTISILEWLILLYFIYTVGYSILFSIAAFYYKSPTNIINGEKQKILVLIPAYKEDKVIVSVAQAAAKHRYPNDKYDVVVIADSLQEETLAKLIAINNVKVIEVKFKNSTKIKSIRTTVNQLDKNYDIAVILDADNLMEKDFLNYINGAFALGIKAVQGQRIAKNTNTSFAILDSLSEIINNHIYRQGAASLGLSCPFIGSGMAIDYRIFNKVIVSIDAVGGFDKDIGVRLIDEGIKVAYIKKAIVLDEKVDNAEVFKNQRKRWISSQYHYLFKYLFAGIGRLFRGNLSYFNSTVLMHIQLPRMLNFGLLFIITIISLVYPQSSSFSTEVWTSLIILFIFSNLIAIPLSFYTRDSLKAIIALPKVFGIMLMIFFKLQRANDSFIHTPHSHNQTKDEK